MAKVLFHASPSRKEQIEEFVHKVAPRKMQKFAAKMTTATIEDSAEMVIAFSHEDRLIVQRWFNESRPAPDLRRPEDTQLAKDLFQGL